MTIAFAIFLWTAMAVPTAAGSEPARAAFSRTLESAPEAERYSAQEGASQESRELYEQGRRQLEQENFSQAVEVFSQLVQRGDYRPDGAMYWWAYALGRGGLSQESLKVLRELIEKYPDSQWINDARRLRGEVRGDSRGVGVGVGVGTSAGYVEGVSVGESAGYSERASGIYSLAGRDELSEKDELRMAVLDSLMRNDPERGLPQVEKILSGDASASVKRRALFVLAQSGHEQAGRILAETARNSEDDSLRHRAVEYLGIYGGEEGFQALEEIYAASSDVRTKREILHSLMLSGRRDFLLGVARQEEDSKLRRAAIHQLGVLGAGEELAAMFKQEQDPQMRSSLLEALFIAGRSETVAEAALNDSDPSLRRNAITKLGALGGETDLLLQIYRQEESPEVRRAVLQALFISASDEALIELVKSEQDPGLRRSIIRLLGLMDSEKAADFLLQLLEEQQ
ncbi:MAG TPA: HEAT repeat domain-containing protein [Acidobacteriota bacterium]|nr:HEAT repeat domain-containing protein [Acidobacteriota bacterium]